jgi:GST-like protein
METESSSPANPLHGKQPEWKPPETIEKIFSALKGQTNSPKAGSQFEKKLSFGDHHLQLFSMATPNGQKVGILLEELGLTYDPHLINIMKGEQFSSGFCEINPNSKIPVLVDSNGPNQQKVNVFESNSILIYLAEREKRFIPQDLKLKVELFNWLFWQASGQGPFTGQYSHFLLHTKSSSDVRDYGVARYGMEVQRMCSVLEKHLENRQYMVGDEYTIADIAIFPWFQFLRKDYLKEFDVNAIDFLSINTNYPNLVKWADRIFERPAVQRGIKVCSSEDARVKACQKEEWRK